jgi:glycosyltransferase involved in cell wall biosynthesis
MPYNMACLNKLTEISNFKIILIRWDEKVLTPYKPEPNTSIKIIKRSEINLTSIKKIINNYNPEMLLVAGRMDKLYLEASVYAKKRGIIVIVGSDNIWKNSIRQNIACLFSYFTYRKYFTHILVSGLWQYEYAIKLGFKKQKILLNYYSADFEIFNNYYQKYKSLKNKLNKKILFLGRFYEVKGIKILLETMEEILKNEKYSDWKLVMIGNGPLENLISQFHFVEKYQFMNQQEIINKLNDIDFFCLPSNDEPWGVVVHEMCAAGLPILLSDKVGSSTKFLIENYNGYKFNSFDKIDLYKKLTMMMNLSLNELRQMGLRSNLLSNSLTPEIWSYNILSILK